eukprot:CAMPEP_0114651222 /NCGR_PEP_ID=MMETSP0191-20121206/8184_1 /TAXON_ID=126664 /ORGANISM="Sorites sp." /LENGTH=575 /DNA_ID=CAMNT_0001865333 /DNA_START=156 /DNA_END=1883 /DNA_ORIENTATION=-
MEERLRLQMSSATRPYDTWTSLKCMGILTAFGLCAAACYPLLWVGMVLICFAKSSQLYAAPLVVLAALGTVYGAGLLMVYYVNLWFHVPLLNMALAACVAIMGLIVVTIGERHLQSKKEELQGANKRFQRLLAQVKYTLTPIATLSCVLPFAWPSALLYATGFVVLLKAFRAVLLMLCWAGCPKPGEQMRVLLSGDSFPPKLDGVQNFARNTIQALVRDGHKVHVFCSNGSPTTHLAPENYGATVTRGPGVEVQPKHKITLPSPHFLLALLKFRPHIIQFFDFTPCALLVVPALWWLGIPVVISHHSRIDLYATYVPGFIGDYSPQVVRAACEVIFPLVTGHLLIDGSQKEQSWFQGHPNTRFWATGCDVEFFHPSKACKEMRELCSNGRPDLPLVIFVGRLSPEKQVDKLIELVQVTNPTGEPELCRFAIIGHGDSWESIHQQIGHRPDVYMPGAVTGEKLAAAVASADIFFSPTVTGTLDLVFIESQAAGLAVVGPKAVAVPLVVADGVNGRLYEPLDMVDAKRAIQEITGGALDKMKAEARKNAKANFTWSKSSAEAIQFHKDVLQYVERCG